MIKTFFCILVILITITYAHGQNGSPGLDALLLESEIIVQGTVLSKYCRQPTNAITAIVNSCVISLDLHEVIKGNPKLSILDVKQHIVNTSKATVTTFDTIKVVCFEHNRNNLPYYFRLTQNPDTSYHQDYDVKIGDAVIVFLKGGSNSYKITRLRVPEDWIVYSLVDQFLGVITANDYVSEYLFKRDKELLKKTK